MLDTAGPIDLQTIDEVPGLLTWFIGGTELTGPVGFERPTYRFVGLASPKLATGTALLASELSYTDGPSSTSRTTGAAPCSRSGTEGGASTRSSLALSYRVADQRGGTWKVLAYGVGYQLRLFSNFTLYAREPANVTALHGPNPPRRARRKKGQGAGAGRPCAERLETPGQLVLPQSSSEVVVPRDGVEPPTRGFSVRCSTN